MPNPILIRRALYSGRAFAPTDIAGLKLWLAADRISGLADGDPVGTWSDLSGQGNHATQATGSKKPTYKTGVQNGKPVVRGDGVDDLLDFPSLPFDVASHDLTILLAFKRGTGGRSVFGSTAYRYLRPDTTTVITYGSGGTSLTLSTGLPGFCIFASRQTSLAIRGFINGMDRTATPGINAGGGALNKLFCGSTIGVANTFLDGDIGEVLIYDSSISDSNLALATSYLKAKWGL